MRTRIATAGVLLAGALAGLLFAPVFGFTELLLPIGVVTLVLFAVTELVELRPKLLPWRPLLLAGAGLLGVTEAKLFSTTVFGIPTGETFGLLYAGVAESWRLTLESTWPARPEPELVLFVPLAVLIVGVLGVEVVRRTRKPLAALLPSLVLLVVSQLYTAVSGTLVVFVALGYAAACVAVIARPVRLSVAPAVALLVAVFAGAFAGSVIDPVGNPAYSLKQDQGAPVPPARVASPLDELDGRLLSPGDPVFSFTTPTPVGRWPLVVLDDFDGVSWTTSGNYRRLGLELPPGPRVTVPVAHRQASITTTTETGRWLPSQSRPAAVHGQDPLVNENTGTLLGSGRPGSYRLDWWEPQIDGEKLGLLPIDGEAPGGFGGLGEIPPGMPELAAKATGGVRPSFQSALQLERYLSENYTMASGADLPSGHGWPQLRHFLEQGKRGTSEQFAAAYVALARIAGIPARLVVGYESPALPSANGVYEVRNADALAWPEVAVAGVGWVPLDPGRKATVSGTAGTLADATAKAKEQLPPAESLEDPTAPPGNGPGSGEDSDGGGWLPPLALLLVPPLALPVGWLTGVPLWKQARRRRRRRAGGGRSVAGAVAEVRDRLRAHRIPVTTGMTVRDLASAAAPYTGQSTVDALLDLAAVADAALWSGSKDPLLPDRAWAAERAVRKGLAKRPLGPRLRASLDPRTS